MIRKKSLFYDNDEDAPLINLTPLIDVVFVILIACIIASPFLNIQNISLAEGNGSHQNNITKDIIITVHQDEKLYLNYNPISLEELKPKLQQLKKSSSNSVPLLVQDGDSSFRSYQKIKSIIESAGFIEFDVALRPE